MHCTVTSRTIAQQIQTVKHHSMSVRIIRCHLHQSGLSARRPLLRLILTGNHWCLRHQWSDERQTLTTKWNDIVFTFEYRFSRQHHDGPIRVWRYRRRRC
ncbi:transposable element Tcb1 transposase [Trichonephila clavipes]|nr:transposable element Tcb1 transposase [Trichonephila clavipes]